MYRQFKVLFPFLMIGIILASLPLLGTTWKRYNPIIGAWPGEEITYYNTSKYNESLKEGFNRWEETGLNLRFREVSNKEEADLVVYSGVRDLRERCRISDCTGWATIGYSPFRQAEMWLLPPTNPYENEVQDFRMLPTIIHEIGHVLGLPHNSDFCSIMNNHDPACREMATARMSNEGRAMLCGPWEKDLDALRELYPEVGDTFSGWCHDPKANWEFYADRQREMIERLSEFREING